MWEEAIKLNRDIVLVKNSDFPLCGSGMQPTGVPFKNFCIKMKST